MAFIKTECTKELLVDLAQEEAVTNRSYQQKGALKSTQAKSAQKLTNGLWNTALVQTVHLSKQAQP